MNTRHLFQLGSILLLVSFLWIPAGYAQDDETEGVFTTFTDMFDGYVKHATKFQTCMS